MVAGSWAFRRFMARWRSVGRRSVGRIAIAAGLTAGICAAMLGLMISPVHFGSAATAAPAPSARSHGNVTFRVIPATTPSHHPSPSGAPTPSGGPTGRPTGGHTSHGALPRTGNSPSFGSLFLGSGLLILFGVGLTVMARSRRRRLSE
jgi:hypothetical protein